MKIQFYTMARNACWMLLVSLLSINLAWGCDRLADPPDLSGCETSAETGTPINASAGTGAVRRGFLKFEDDMKALTTTVVTSGAIKSFGDFLFYTFGIIFIAWRVGLMAMGGFRAHELLLIFLTIGFTKMLMASYITLTTGLWDWAEGLGKSIQSALTGGSADLYYPFQQLLAFASQTWETGCVLCVDVQLLAVGLSILSALLVVAAAFTSIWGFWGFCIAKILGYLFIPMIMFERLSFLFDGWLKFLFGFLFYAIVARVNLSLTIVSIKLFFNNYAATAGAFPADISVDSLASMLGFVCFFVVGIISLFATGKLAGTLVAGAGGGGIGGPMMQAVQMGAKVAAL